MLLYTVALYVTFRLARVNVMIWVIFKFYNVCIYCVFCSAHYKCINDVSSLADVISLHTS